MDKIKGSIASALTFADSIELEDEFRLFARSDIGPFARCFAIFVRALCKDNEWLERRAENLILELNTSFDSFFAERVGQVDDVRFDKSILQLLCFTLSALNILNGDLSEKNQLVVKSYVQNNLTQDLKTRGVFLGAPGSGNFAMFRAILSIFSEIKGICSVPDDIEKWVSLHKECVNSQGFWGKSKKMTFLQFQNGYHQYEIFEYLKIEDLPWQEAAKNVMKLADRHGHFAPYPGGGGCYDYDAIFMLTNSFCGDVGQEEILLRSLNTLLSEQNFDGGFCESRLFRSKNWMSDFGALVTHVLNQPSYLYFSSFLAGLNLFRSKHHVVTTHWTEVDRFWEESNLWDTFFRLSAIARIADYLEMPEKDLFEWNEFPGIG